MKFTLSILLLLFGSSLFAARISGSVVDQDGNPLGFATILIKGTRMGATANSDGMYHIDLAPGRYAVECRYVGYTTTEKRIVVEDKDITLDFVLTMQRLELAEIVIDPNAEDPAYDIIRNAIRQRPYYDAQVSAFTADVYIKGIVKLLSLPDKILGRKIPDNDKKELALDSSGQGIIYLSESITHVSEQKPDKRKLEVISTRVSGSDGFGFDFPIFISFYKNIVDVSQGAFSKRGFVSPIADNALNFYNYKFLGSFFEDGKQINTIQVIPKRRFEPLFSGVINITEGDWRIFSCKLYVTKDAQLQVLDSLEVTQIHTPQYPDIWRVKNQVIHFHAKQLGVEVEGDFVNVYSNYDLEPDFKKGFFNRVVIKYDSGSNKRTDTYWDTMRPVPLEAEEIRDFEKKDSIKTLRDSVVYNRDSLRKLQRAPTLMDFLIFDVNRKLYGPKSAMTVQLEGLLKGLQYNTVEGVSINPSLVLSKYIKPAKATLEFIADVRYGFNNHHVNPWAGLVFTDRYNPREQNKFKNYKFYAAGGKRVSQFFKLTSLTGLANSVSTLLYGWNNMKLYENYFFKTGFQKSWESGAGFLIEGLFEDRMPLENTTDFLFNDKWKKRLTPNYPVEVLNHQFTPHQAVVLHTSFRFQPGQRYIQYPDVKYSLGSKLPVFTVHYYKGIPRVFGSDEDFDRWQLDVEDEIQMKLAGRLVYLFSTGGFLNDKKVFVQDYKHYQGSDSHIADEYGKAFQYTTMYQYSNQSPFYAEVHLEHHSDGLITNKIPLLRRWNWHLVEGANALFISPQTHHLEVFAGLENIFKIFRVDVLMRLQDGFKPALTYRVGFGGLIGDAANRIRFARHQKIITAW